MDHRNVLEGNTEAITHQHRPCCAVTLSIWRRTRDHLGMHRTIGTTHHFNNAKFGTTRHCSDLDVYSQSESELHVRSTLTASLLFSTQFVVSRNNEQLFHSTRIITTVVYRARPICIRKLVLGYEIAASNLCWIHTNFGSEDIDSTLNRCCRFRATSTAISQCWHGICHH